MEEQMQPSIPSNHFIDKVLEDDSFFSSIAQCLKQLKGARTNSQELWQKCQEHVKEFLDNSCAFDLQPTTIYGMNVQDYLDRLEKVVKGPPNSVMSRPEQEGRIICQVFNVKIHILNKPDHENSDWWHSIVSRLGQNRITDVDYESINTMHVIRLGDLHFKPLLKSTQELCQDFNRLQVNEDHEATTETYEVREGTRGSGGHFYEIKLLMLFYLRLQVCDEFYLAGNMANVGAFDDAVFKYKVCDKDGIIKTKIVFLQAKHSDKSEEGRISIDSLLHPKGAFSLRKYFESLQTIKRSFEIRKGPIFKECFDDCRFIIFTNYGLDFKRKKDERHISNARRWMDCVVDEIVLGKGNTSKHLISNEDINRDIIAKLSCNPICELAQEIYDYTLGCKKEIGIKAQNKLLQKYHIALANKVFVVNKDHRNKSRFSSKFHESESLWNEFCNIADKPENEKYKKDLIQVTINLHKTFGKNEHKLGKDSRNNLIEELLKIIVCSKSYNIKISKPPEDIDKLANHVLVGVEEEGSKNIVKFCDSEPSDDAHRLMNDLKSNLKQKQTEIPGLDIMKIRFQIKDFPILSLPMPDEVVTEAEVKEFLTKLEFVTGQKNENQLDEVIKAELHETCKVNDEERDATFESLKSRVESWWKHGNSYLKKDTMFVEDALTSLSQMQLNPFQDIGKKGIQINEVKFEDTVLDELKDIILRQKLLNIVSEKGTSLLSSVKVCQTLDRAYQDKSYIFMQVHHLLNIQNHVTKVFKSNNQKPYFLVIQSNSELLDSAKWANEENIRSFYDCLFNIIKISTDKYTIIITEIGDITHFDCNVSYLHKIPDNTNLNHLTTESQQLLLNKEVILQEMPVKINELIPECNDKFQEEITSKLLMNLINNTNTVISKAPQRLSESEAAFSRFYEQMPSENLVKMIKQPDDNTMIVISGIKGLSKELLKHELVNLLGNEGEIANHVNERTADKTIIIPCQNNGSNLKEFKQICAKNSEKTIYWVDVNLEEIRLQQVFYPNFYLKREFRRYEKVVLNPELLCQENSPEMLIFRTTADEKKVQKLLDELEEKCLLHFKTHCSNQTIIFRKDSRDASAVFGSVQLKNNSVHRLQIANGNKLSWLESKGTRPKAQIGNPVYELDLFIGGSNPHVFIFGDLADKQKLTNMIKSSCSHRKSLFHYNCDIGRIRFFEDGDVMEETEQVNRTTHWLKFEDSGNEQLIWEETHGSISKLRKFIDKDKCKQKLYTEDIMSKLEDKVVVIADEPGMGKTTSLTSVSQQMLDENWVIRINLLDCEHAIDTIKESELTMEDVYNFVSKVESTGLRNDWVKLLMKYKLTLDEPNSRLLLFLFDGFDEINKEKQPKILLFLQFIKCQTTARLWVTTRFHTMDILENRLSVFATKFDELSQKDRLEFLNRSWIVRISPFLKTDNIKQRTEKYSYCLLQKASDILGEKLSHILGVPLQLRLLAEGLRHDYVNYMNSGDDRLLNFSHVDVLYVYLHFIQEKYEIYIRDKNRINVNEQFKLPIFRSFVKKHEMIAFKLLFPEGALITPQRLLKADEDMLKSVGIIQSIGENSKPYFIHRTFAEYFAAKLLFRYVGKKESNSIKYDSAAKFMNKHIFEASNHVIRNFIHHMSIEPNKDFPIHFAAFRNKLRDIIGLMKDTNNCNNFDKLERTPLHIAAWEGHLNVVKVLLDSGCDAIAQDVFGKTALHNAVMKKQVKVVEHILNYTADINICGNIFSTPLHVDVEVGDSLFRDPEQLKSKLIKLTNTKDIDAKTALHYATEMKDWGIASMLIVHGANVTPLTDETALEILDHISSTRISCAEEDEFGYSMDEFGISGEYILGLLMLKFVILPTNRVTAVILKYLWAGHIKVFDTVRGHLSDHQISEILHRFTKIPPEMKTICDEDHLKVSKYLMKQSNNERMANTLAKDAARLDNLETMKYVLAQGHKKDYISYMECAIKGHNSNIVKHLQGHFLHDNDGNTALHLAARSGSLQITKYLVENNADVKALNNARKTPLDIALRYRAIVKPYLKVKRNSDYDKPQVKSNSGNKQSTQESLSASTSNAFPDGSSIVGHCHGNDIIRNASLLLSNQSASSARITEDELAEYFCKYPEGTDEFGATKLHWAALFGIIDHKLILNDYYEEVIEITDNNGYTPLHYAVTNDQIDMAKHLLFYHANFNPKSKQGKTPLDISKDPILKTFLQEIHYIFNIFQNGGSKIESLKSMQLKNNDSFISAISCKDDYGNALLGYAASSNDIDSVLFILRNGGSFTLCSHEQGGSEVRHLFRCLFYIKECIRGNEGQFALQYIKCFDKYIGIGDVRGYDNENFLHAIANSNSVNYYLLNYLVKQGTDINALDNCNKSVISCAIKHTNLDLVKFLLYKGVNIKDLDSDDKQKLFDCANKNDRPDITDLFETLLQQSELLLKKFNWEIAKSIADQQG